jgi:hypothetical protein
VVRGWRGRTGSGGSAGGWGTTTVKEEEEQPPVGMGGFANWRASGCGPTVEVHAGGVRSRGR